MIAGIHDIATTDEQLAEIIAQREWSAQAMQTAREACSQLYLRHARKLLAFLAARVNRSDTEDIHQAIWERVWQHLPERFRGGNFRAWLYQIARNYLIDLGRLKKAEPCGDAFDRPDSRQERPDELLLQRELRGVLGRCLERLDADSALVVRARLAGESYPEICQRTGLTPERAHKLFHRAKEQLQACVKRAMS